MIEGQPTWVGAGADAVFAWIHTPQDGTSRGIVVVGAPIGREQSLSVLAVRRLCIQAARAGYTAVRFTWRGMGDSHELPRSEDLLQGWQADALAVVDHVRDRLGVPEIPVHGVGYRAGAAVLGTLADRFESFVAWEPLSGRSMVRQWSRLRGTVARGIPQRPDEVDLLTVSLSPVQAEALSALPIPSGERVAEFKEKDRRRAKGMYGVEPYDTRLHDDVFAAVLDLLPAGSPLSVRTGDLTVAQNRWTDDDGVELLERIVLVGPDRRTGVVTWRAGLESAETAVVASDGALDPEGRDLHWSAPGVIVSAGGPDGRAGGGEWSATSRALAAQGAVVLRADRPLAADSLPVDDLRASSIYTVRSTQGLQEMVDWLRERGCGQVHGALHCSSAWAACLGEIAGTPVRTDSMLLVCHAEWKMNVDWWTALRESYDADLSPQEKQLAKAAFGVVDVSTPGADPLVEQEQPGDAAAQRRPSRLRPVLTALRSRDLGTAKSAARDGAVHWLRHDLPHPLWRQLGRRGLVTTPESMLEPMASRQPVTILNGPDDLPRWEQTRSDRAVQRLAARGLPIRELRTPRMDHSLLTVEARRALTEAVLREVPVGDRG